MARDHTFSEYGACRISDAYNSSNRARSRLAEALPRRREQREPIRLIGVTHAGRI